MPCLRSTRGEESPAGAAAPGEAAFGGSPASGPRLKVEIHGAALGRSFARLGSMSCYAVVSVSAREVGRTPVARRTHLHPSWDSSCTLAAGVPESVAVAVWGANRFHRDVFCGCVTVPCSDDMGDLEAKDFSLTKRGQQTGSVRLSLALVMLEAKEGTRRRPMRTTNSMLGGELDHMMSWSELPAAAPANNTLSGSSLRLAEPEEDQALAREAAGGPVRPAASVASVATPARAAARAGSQGSQEKSARLATLAAAAAGAEIVGASTGAGPEFGASLVGSWKCVATHGLDGFLKQTGVGSFQRKLAASAKWPSWDFSLEGRRLRFVNHSAMGDMREDIPVDGQEYARRDGRGNNLTCRASWEATREGGVLTISRTGAIGTYEEQRRVAGGSLEFVLSNGDGAFWGRSFQRA